jgi:hypothetical protein
VTETLLLQFIVDNQTAAHRDQRLSAGVLFLRQLLRIASPEISLGHDFPEFFFEGT